MDCKRFLQENIDWIKNLAARASRLGGAPSYDTPDFQSHVLMKLVEREYSILRQFRGDSSIKTYLHQVVQRLWLDFLRSKNGKWRPSAVAVRLGSVAVELERLLYRDGIPLTEAVALIRHRRGLAGSSGGLCSLAAKLPVRPPRSFIPADGVEALPVRACSPEEDLERWDRARRRRQLQQILHQVFRDLDRTDRWLLRKRFKEQRTVAEIADNLGIDAKKLYRRFDRMMRRLREALEDRGVTLKEVSDMFGRASNELRIPLTLSSQNATDRG